MLRAPLSGTLPGASEAGVLALFVGFLAATMLDAHFGLLRRIRSSSGLSLVFHAVIIIACLSLGSTGETRFIYFQF